MYCHNSDPKYIATTYSIMVTMAIPTAATLSPYTWNQSQQQQFRCNHYHQHPLQRYDRLVWSYLLLCRCEFISGLMVLFCGVHKWSRIASSHGLGVVRASCQCIRDALYSGFWATREWVLFSFLPFDTWSRTHNKGEAISLNNLNIQKFTHILSVSCGWVLPWLDAGAAEISNIWMVVAINLISFLRKEVDRFIVTGH